MYKMASGVHVLASELLAALRSECDEARASLAMCKMGFTPCKCGTCHECQARAAGDCDALK
jgi:hypothetical protein